MYTTYDNLFVQLMKFDILYCTILITLNLNVFCINSTIILLVKYKHKLVLIVFSLGNFTNNKIKSIIVHIFLKIAIRFGHV